MSMAALLCGKLWRITNSCQEIEDRSTVFQ